MDAAPRTWLFVDAAEMFGGHEVMLLRWIEELQKGRSGVRPRLLAREGSRLQALAPAGTLAAPFAQIAQVAPRRAGVLGRLGKLWRDLQTLRRALREERPAHVVFASGALGAHMLLVTLARLWGASVLVYVPLLDTFTAMGFRAGWLQDRLVRWLYAEVPSGWVVLTAGQAEHFRRWAGPRGPVFVLPNTVAPAIETATRLPPRRLAPSDPLRVLVLGRLDAHQKGLDLLLDFLERAAPAVRERLAFCIAGEGPYGRTLQARLAASPALQACVQTCAWMPADEALAACDVLLIGSRFEGVPLVMLEAMALGVPVVASELPGTAAYLPRGSRFAVGDFDHAARLLLGLRDLERRCELAAEGRAVYEARASNRAFAQVVAALMPEIERRLRPRGGARAGFAAPLPDEPL